MSIIKNLVRSGFYLDSVALMRVSASLRALSGVEEIVLMIGTQPNKDILRDANVLDEVGEAASPADLIVAVRADDTATAAFALEQALEAIDTSNPTPQTHGAAAAPRTLKGALASLPDANLALISTSGTFAVREARQALAAGLNVMLFSDNIAIADELALKQQADAAGLIVMGPDCGTAYVSGIPLAFANIVKSGDVGVVAASGTGLQEVAVLFHNADRGLSHGIGVGGRDLHDEIGAISTLRAIEWLEEDVQTRHILLISKPPGPQVTKQLMTRLARSSKPVTVCLLGATDLAAGPNVAIESTLKGAVQRVTGQTLNDFDATRISSDGLPPQLAARQGVLGLFSGGTLATEAAIVMARSDVRFEVIDLGADEYTVGRPHPMIDPSARMIRLERALQDSELRVVLLDVVLGLGSHRHPAGAICEVLARAPANSPAIVAYVCGTEDDPQSLSKQTRALEQAGVLLAPTNADAAMLASAIAGA